MNEHIFNEKESLELITQMIQKTRKELEVGSGNVFLCYGYTSVILAIAVYLITHFTTQPAWNFLYPNPSSISKTRSVNHTPYPTPTKC